MVTGEVLGLEVARVVVDDAGAAALEVGVGRHDRDAFADGAGDLPTRRRPRRASSTPCASHRRAGAEAHLLNRLAPERWLRSVLVDRPDLVGAARLHPVAAVVARGTR